MTTYTAILFWGFIVFVWVGCISVIATDVMDRIKGK